MQKFLNYFIAICVIIIGAISAIKLFYSGGEQALGGSYLEKVGSIAKETGVIMNDIVPYLGADTTATPDETLNKVVQTKEKLIHLNDQAKALSSPNNMQGLHQQFMDSLNNYVTAFQLTEEGLQGDDNNKLGQAGDFLIEGANQMKGVSEGLLQLAREQQ